MNGKLTRRQLAAALAPAVALAQTVAAPPAAAIPEDEIQVARERMKTNAAALAAVDLPMAVEPAFQFKV